MKEFDLTDDQVNEIKNLFSRLVATKNLIKEFTKDDSAEALERLIQDLSDTQFKYDKWFADMEKKFNIVTLPTNSWDVDFNNKKMILN